MKKGIADGEIRAILIGTLTGFIPTVTLCFGRIMQMLTRDKRIMKAAKKRAADDDAGLLEDLLFEVARLNPTLQPGQFRVAAHDAVIAPGTSRQKRVEKGQVILVATMSALRDPRAFRSANPDRFVPDRSPEPDLAFGVGPHWCAGLELAKRLVTEMMRNLLREPGLRPVAGPEGRLAYVGIAPSRLDMKFEVLEGSAQQTPIIACIPVTSGISKAKLEEEISRLGNPADEAVAKVLDETKFVHFASLTVVECEDLGGLRLLVELNVDGPAERVLETCSTKLDSLMGDTFEAAGYPGSPAKIIMEHMLDLQPRLSGTTGLNFSGSKDLATGTSDFPVRDILHQQRLAAFTRDAVQDYQKANIGGNAPPLGVIEHVRGLIRGSSTLEDRIKALEADRRLPEAEKLRSLMKTGSEFAADIIRPGRKGLAFAQWVAPTRLELVKGIVLYVITLLYSYFFLVSLIIGVVAFSIARFLGSSPSPGQVFTELFLSFVATPILVVGLTLFAIAILFYRQEQQDVPDDTPADVAQLRAISRSENPPGYAQNFIIATPTLKPGFLRRVALVVGFLFVVLTLKMFRPGYVTTFATIHYARWFRMPGSNKLVFMASYDGSWESYLEDFIMRAHPGQTAVWSNCVGFPKTRALVFAGSEDGDRFKRWVRRQQRVAHFWYSAYPDVTNANIRLNALICDGLARARNDDAARSWLELFGSTQRPEQTIQSEEVQSLVFDGLGDLPFSACIVLKGPEDAAKRRRWLRGVIYGSTDRNGLNGDLCVTFGEGGDYGRRQNAAFLAFTAKGLANFNLPGLEGNDGLASFPGVFNIGMTNRARVLGDTGVSAAVGGNEWKGWNWTDSPPDERVAAGGEGDAKGPPWVEAALLVYGVTAHKRDTAVRAHLEWMNECGIVKIHSVDTDPVIPSRVSASGNTVSYNHFGFREGISQPVLRGSRRMDRNALTHDIVEPGEFLFGYKNNEGYRAPTPYVRASTDASSYLPVNLEYTPVDFPDFGADDSPNAMRDFGRNGTFLVIRQLAQDVAGFAKFTKDQANAIRDRYPDLQNTVGDSIDADWVAAKLMGRRKDGSPLVDSRVSAPGPTDNPFAWLEERSGKRNEALGSHATHHQTVRRHGAPVMIESATGPLAPPRHEAQDAAPANPPHAPRVRAHRRGGEPDTDNDFMYGVDDPMGLQCPLGAHIRRANPRDSLNPGDMVELAIANRHRLIRRGRSYDCETREGTPEKGLLFVGLCADIERQFEFIQQTWIGSKHFHGLSGEPDPIAAPRKTFGEAGDGAFTIPTVRGPVVLDGIQSFATVRAGGYFFLPSRSALNYLIGVPPLR